MNHVTSPIQVRLWDDDVTIFAYSHAAAMLIRLIENVPMFVDA
jgi:hypothetical protein